MQHYSSRKAQEHRKVGRYILSYNYLQIWKQLKIYNYNIILKAKHILCYGLDDAERFLFLKRASYLRKSYFRCVPFSKEMSKIGQRF